MNQRLPAAILGMMLAASSHAASPINIEALGSVRHPGMHTLPTDARLSAAALAAGPDEQAYMLGAALLRSQAVPAQARLKAGVLFDLELLAAQSSTAEAATHMQRQFQHMPVTGRAMQMLDPRPLEATLAQNTPAQNGDRLVYPRRPDTVSVIGAVLKPCTFRHDSLTSATTYRAQCPAFPAANRDALFVIQPDGSHQKIGIAAWNRQRATSLAPGAVVFVPLAEHLVRNIAPAINEEAAAFLATQVLDAR
ncbi:MAG: capsule biosynthesis GfcC family protein [Stenotrophomonas sp.]|uniref:capsule biosynthesis GfcC family protein n=1 Tax=Stenotrophomonas sp. TaxID=69392 RepID=UPI003D6D57AA